MGFSEIIAFVLGMILGWVFFAFLAAAIWFKGTFLIDESDPVRDIYRIVLNEPIERDASHVLLKVERVNKLESANDSDHIMEQ